MKRRQFAALALSLCLFSSQLLAVTSEIKDKYGTSTAMTITLASLATSLAGVGRQSTMIDNSTVRASEAIVYVKITTGTTPTANKPIYIFLLRGDNPSSSNYRTDGAGASDAGVTINNAQILGTIMVTAATSNTAYYGEFSTRGLGALGPEWGIAVVHEAVSALNSTGSNHFIRYIAVNPESQ